MAQPLSSAKGMVINMTTSNLRMLLSSLLMLLEIGNTEKAIEVLRNSIEYIDKNSAASAASAADGSENK